MTEKLKPPLQLHRASRERVVADAVALFEKANFGTNPAASCLQWSACVVFAASTLGTRLVVQAGSAHFLRLPDHLDDGKDSTLTHFSYVWDDRESLARAKAALPMGILPEMHVWAADPARQEIVDLTTKYLPNQCVELGEMPWLAPPPPERLWVHTSKLPSKWHYEASRVATVFAMALMVETIMPVIKKAVSH